MVLRYLETERNYTSTEVLTTMAPAILVLASGYFIGGAWGIFSSTHTARTAHYCHDRVITGAVFLTITMNVR